MSNGVPVRIEFLHLSPNSPQRATWSDEYPWGEVTEYIAGLTDSEREIQVDRLGHTRTSVVSTTAINNLKWPLLEVHNVDLWRTHTVSKAGAVRREKFDDDEGPTTRSYLMHLEGQIAAFIHGGNGPQPGEVSSYIGVVAGLEYEPKMTRIKSTDTRKILDSITKASSMTLSMSRANARAVAPGDNLLGVFRAAHDHVECEEVEIRFRSPRRARQQKRLVSTGREALERLLHSHALEELQTAELGTKNLFEALVATHEYIPFGRGTDADTDVIVRAMQKAYRAKRDIVHDALGISMPPAKD